MKIDWTALLLVAGVSITSTVVFVALLAYAIRLVSVANVHTRNGEPAAANLAVGYGLLALAASLVLIGLYFIVPQFH